MNIFHYIFRAVFRIKWWLLILPLLFALLAIYMTRNLDRQYKTDVTIYTGVISSYGSDPGESNASSNWNVLNNSIQNIINTINSKETLKRLSLNLYARLMIHGDLKKDNVYISAKHYKQLLDITPKDVRALIDKSSEENTVRNLERYEKPDRNNFVYGLFNWNHPYFSYGALKENIKISRIDNSDILQVNYQANDPGIAYQTLEVLSKVFAIEYTNLQFGSTNNVIRYFEAELARLGRELRGQEDSLTNYNVENRVINYDKQTEAIAVLDKEYELRYQDVVFAYNSAQAALKQLESGMDANMRSIKNNSEFLSRMNHIADLNYDISRIKTLGADSLTLQKAGSINTLSSELNKQEKEFRTFMDQYSSEKYTRNGYPNANYVKQWVEELLKFKSAEAELNVGKNFKQELDQKYTQYSPIGSVLKRKERSINFSEQSYLSILTSLNAARLRLKSLEMNSATLKVINPATFPLNALPYGRKAIVIGVFLGTIAFILGILLILELFDRTLRDKIRTERITKGKVVAAFPKLLKSKNLPAIEERAVHVLANRLYGYYDNDSAVNFINVVKLSTTLDSSRITELLTDYWSKMGLKVRGYYEGQDFESQSREYLVGQEWVNQLVDYDLSLVQHGSMALTPIPNVFLERGMATLLVLRADTVWKTEDELLFSDLLERSAGRPIVICLMNAQKYVVEEFTGMLPPFTFLRRLEYQLANFGLTSLGK
ncbi:hypothetical protein MUB18_05725 [Sphingobacterium sp. PCS056]|uniref:hypothetical protein n=1 Tax=Sphingobacterium sp. PCS056 TaxID=2931400 RepID=UPI00200D53FF|nr:hypothetical protein [Sphingobacterium sp. PCS056]UPZ37795.1 hypothetical protein MUB18_05725 [Sphingobacterium sp. PCS056]